MTVLGDRPSPMHAPNDVRVQNVIHAVGHRLDGTARAEVGVAPLVLQPQLLFRLQAQTTRGDPTKLKHGSTVRSCGAWCTLTSEYQPVQPASGIREWGVEHDKDGRKGGPTLVE